MRRAPLRSAPAANGRGGRAPRARPALPLRCADRPYLPAAADRREAPFARAGSLSAAGGRAGALSLQLGEPHLKRSEGARRLHRRRRGEGTKGGGGRAGPSAAPTPPPRSEPPGPSGAGAAEPAAAPPAGCGEEGAALGRRAWARPAPLRSPCPRRRWPGCGGARAGALLEVLRFPLA